MTKRNAIIAAVLLLVSAVIIQLLIVEPKMKLDKELINFFSGFLGGIGAVFLVQSFVKKKDA
jgi:uncharacterized membrane protein YccC